MDIRRDAMREATQGLKDASRLRLRFWQRQSLALADAEAALDRVDRCGDAGSSSAVALVRALSPTYQTPAARLSACKETLYAVSLGLANTGPALAGLALSLLTGATAAAPAKAAQVCTTRAEAIEDGRPSVASLYARLKDEAPDKLLTNLAAAPVGAAGVATALLAPMPAEADKAWLDEAIACMRDYTGGHAQLDLAREISDLPISNPTRRLAVMDALYGLAEPPRTRATWASRLLSREGVDPGDADRLAAWAQPASGSPWKAAWDALTQAWPTDTPRAPLHATLLKEVDAPGIDRAAAARCVDALKGRVPGDALVAAFGDLAPLSRVPLLDERARADVLRRGLTGTTADVIQGATTLQDRLHLTQAVLAMERRPAIRRLLDASPTDGDVRTRARRAQTLLAASAGDDDGVARFMERVARADEALAARLVEPALQVLEDRARDRGDRTLVPQAVAEARGLDVRERVARLQKIEELQASTVYRLATAKPDAAVERCEREVVIGGIRVHKRDASEAPDAVAVAASVEVPPQTPSASEAPAAVAVAAPVEAPPQSPSASEAPAAVAVAAPVEAPPQTPSVPQAPALSFPDLSEGEAPIPCTPYDDALEAARAAKARVDGLRIASNRIASAYFTVAAVVARDEARFTAARKGVEDLRLASSWTPRAIYTVAALQTHGLAAADKLGRAMSMASGEARAAMALGAAISPSEQAARQAYAHVRATRLGLAQESRTIALQAAAIAGDTARFDTACAVASSLDPNANREVRAMLTVAAACAPSEAAAREAFRVATQFDRLGDRKSRARRMLAAVVAGNGEAATVALTEGRKMSPSNREAAATYALATALAMRPEWDKPVPAFFFEEEK